MSANLKGGLVKAISPAQADSGQEDKFIGRTVHKRFAIVKSIGKGSYGSVYQCKNMESGSKYAVKIESLPHGRRPKLLGVELDVYKTLGNSSPVIPQIVASGHIRTNVSYLVMELMGPSLSSLRHSAPEERFTLESTLRLGLYMIKAINAIHKAGYVHCDVKPGNFCVTRRGHGIRVLDMGIARHIDDMTPVTGFRGTPRYASPHTHHNRRPAPRDDYWGVLYSMVEMLVGRLPWESDTVQGMGHSKERWMKQEDLGLPRCFGCVIDYLTSLSVYDQVDHHRVSVLLGRELKRRGLPIHGKYDWEMSADSLEGGFYKPRPARESPMGAKRVAVRDSAPSTVEVQPRRHRVQRALEVGVAVMADLIA